MKKKNKKLIWIAVGIIAVLLIWGIIGSSQASQIGVNCDIGIGQDGSAFCWKWHKNVVGELGDAFNELLGR